jgi:uncharacterized protein
VIVQSSSKTSAAPKKANRLIHEKSPYLQQHAYNPVDWFPWGDEAFEKARRENKPIFLSIGYSTCHWCHVMERESFESPELAKILNNHFISIKVDREERPDLDQIYMAATQAMTGSGGWPMSVWLNHDLKPFYTGTYFPPRGVHGRPGFGDLLLKIHEAWTQNRAKVDSSAENVSKALEDIVGGKGGDGEPSELSPTLPEDAYQYFCRAFDPRDGGFGSAPKFPRVVQFPFLFRYYKAKTKKEAKETGVAGATANNAGEKALEMALYTLRKMAQGGIYDHLGGGFARYSVDAEWRVPHFEKMLYDNAQLLSTYAEAWQITKDDFYRNVALDITRYILRDMTHPEGGFYSAEDADSEGEEGKFYVWTMDELEDLLGKENARVVAYHFDFSISGNFEHGKNVLHSIHSLESTAQRAGKTTAETKSILEESKRKMFEHRNKRTRPLLDDKILTSWNGLMIAGMAKAGRTFKEPHLIKAAESAAAFVLTQLRDKKSGRLIHRFREGEAKGAGFLDDYAFLIEGLIELFIATQEIRWLREAEGLCDLQIELFWDESHGGRGFFFTTKEDASLILRPKADYEGAEPAGNSVSALNLIKLAQLLDRPDLDEKARQTIMAGAGTLKQFPASMPLMLSAYMDQSEGGQQIVIAGEEAKEDFQKLWREVMSSYLPNTVVVRVLEADSGEGFRVPEEIRHLAEGKTSVDGKAAAYVCRNFTCQAPIVGADNLTLQL